MDNRKTVFLLSMEKRTTQYFKHLFHIILQMLPIPLHDDLVPNEIRL